MHFLERRAFGTVNNYLAVVMRKWNGPIFEFLGLMLIALIARTKFQKQKEKLISPTSLMEPTRNGFDYLRDKCRGEPKIWCNANIICIVDEVIVF